MTLTCWNWGREERRRERWTASRLNLGEHGCVVLCCPNESMFGSKKKKKKAERERERERHEPVNSTLADSNKEMLVRLLEKRRRYNLHTGD